MLGFRIDPDPALGPAPLLPLHPINDLLQGWNLIAGVVKRITLVKLREVLLGAERLEFGQREVFREPAADKEEAQPEMRLGGLLRCSTFLPGG
jgi:hypothetical protein